MAAQYDLRLVRGSRATRTLTLRNSDTTPKDLTGFSVRFRIRENSAETDLLELNSTSGDVSIVPLDGIIVLTLTAAQTEALPFLSGTYRVDLVDALGDAERLMFGAVLLTEF